MCSYGVQQAAGLAELQAVSSQLRLQAALLIQQVRHQNTDQVGAAGTGQHLDLHTHTNMVAMAASSLDNCFHRELKPCPLSVDLMGLYGKNCPVVNGDTNHLLILFQKDLNK